MIPRWRQLARALLPEIFEEERPDSLYAFFSDLSRCRHKAHKAGDDGQLARIHAFASWCARHKEQYIWNAAGVAFYEHLFDGDAQPEQVVPWLSRQAYADIKGLLAWRLGEEKAAEIDQVMSRRGGAYDQRVQSTLIEHLTILAKAQK